MEEIAHENVLGLERMKNKGNWKPKAEEKNTTIYESTGRQRSWRVDKASSR